jgi:ribosomal RNA-processing protein 1
MYRLDKFYLLIRRFVHASFLLLARENWDRQAIAEYNAILTGPGGPLQYVPLFLSPSLS